MNGNHDDAIAAFRRSLALAPGMVDAQVSLFEALKRSGRTGEAEAMVDELLRDHSDDPEVLVQIAELRERQGRYDEALALMRSPFVDLGPGSSAYPEYLRMLIGAQHWEEASIESGWAFKVPTLWTAVARLARILALLHFGEHDMARTELAAFDANEYASTIEQWAVQLDRSGAIEPIRRLLADASRALTGDPTLERLREQFGAI